MHSSNFGQFGRLSGRPRLVLGAGLALAIMAATPTLAQKGAPPPASDPMADALAFCAAGADDMTGAALQAAGWNIDDAYEYSPFYRSLTTSRNDDDYGFVTVETYATVQLIYCTYDIAVADPSFDLQAAADAQGLNGQVASQEDGLYGAWERTGSGDGMLVQASISGGYFYLELNHIIELPD